MNEPSVTINLPSGVTITRTEEGEGAFRRAYFRVRTPGEPATRVLVSYDPADLLWDEVLRLRGAA